MAEFSLINKTWYRINLPEAEKEKEWADNLPRREPQMAKEREEIKPKSKEKLQGSESEESTSKPSEDEWEETKHIVEESEGEAMRRRMKAACQLHKRRTMCPCSACLLSIVFIIISVILLSFVLSFYATRSDKTFRSFDENSFEISNFTPVQDVWTLNNV